MKNPGHPLPATRSNIPVLQRFNLVKRQVLKKVDIKKIKSTPTLLLQSIFTRFKIYKPYFICF